jgi:hypothetical protein
MAGESPLAALARLGESLGLLQRAETFDPAKESKSAEGSTNGQGAIVRSAHPARGKVRYLACWRENGRICVADLPNRATAADTASASGQGGADGRAGSRSLKIRDVQVSPLAPADAAKAVDLLSGLVKADASERTIDPAGEGKAAHQPDLDAAA